MALLINIIVGRGFTNEEHCELLISKEEQGNTLRIAVHYSKSRLASCTLLTRWSASVLIVSVPMQVAELIKEDWPIVLQEEFWLFILLLSLKYWSVKQKNYIYMHCYVFLSDSKIIHSLWDITITYASLLLKYPP